MKEIVEIIAKSLVDNPSAVVINEKEEDNVVIYELHVATEDMGKVIGKQGRIAKALLRDFPQITSIDLWLTKTCPPMGADCEGAGVEIHLINDKTD